MKNSFEQMTSFENSKSRLKIQSSDAFSRYAVDVVSSVDGRDVAQEVEYR
ncbi:hypothetical protein K0504_06145 [Neiella marina]|uniref:Uncharacterized protein n=1 Tax=Neiella holothuriorum TaxID=2870530 RepID=A0ABS7EFB0_9GAMM|nr:hypothetical protein [Neiella holothuriorum]MBW8190613.1 hypothetical protein [Neiella holothuriorum]